MQRKFIESVAKSLKDHRIDFEPHYRELSDYFNVRRGLFNSDPAEQERVDRGRRINRKVLDSTPFQALRILKSGMQAGITSPSRPWFKIVSGNPELKRRPAVKAWFAAAEAEARTVLNQSGLYNVFHTGYGDLGVLGTEAAFIWDDDLTALRGLQLLPGSYWLGSNDDNTVDTLYREYSLTVQQMVGKFVYRGNRFGSPDWSRVPNAVMSQYDSGDYGKLHKVRHMVMPRTERDIRSQRPDQKPIASIYWHEDNGGAKKAEFALETGFDLNPISASRWEVEGNEVYGRSPAMEALPDAKELMDKRRDWLEMLKRLNRPPMNAPMELRNGFSLAPAAINFMADPSKGLVPAYQVPAPTEPLRSDIQDTRDKLWSAMYADLFMMISNLDRRQITAREIDERHEEKLIAIGPVLERLHFEKLTPIVLRVINRAEAMGRLPPRPQELAEGGELNIEYISLLAQAQRAVATGGIERLWAFAGNISAAKPDILDKLDGDATMDEYAEMLGVPPSVVRATEDVEQLRAERAEAQAQAAQLEAAVQAAPAMQQAAQAGAVLSQADSPRGAAPGDVLRRLGLQ